MKLVEIITKDLHLTMEKYKESCSQNHFIEAAALREMILVQKKYLRLARQEELRTQTKVSDEQVQSARNIAWY